MSDMPLGTFAESTPRAARRPGSRVAARVAIPLLVGAMTAVTTPATATTVGPIVELIPSRSAASLGNPAIAWDVFEEVYVIVWEDDRTSGNNGDVYLARLDPNLDSTTMLADGTFSLLDTDGVGVLPPAEQGATERTPVIAYGETEAEFVIAWVETPSGGSSNIRAARYTVGNSPQAAIDVTSTADPVRAPSIVWENDQYLIAYETLPPTFTPVVQGRRANNLLDGFLDASPVTLDGGGGARDPALTGVGGEFFVTWWTDQGNVEARTVPATGTIPAPSVTTIGPSGNAQRSPGIGPVGTGQVYIAWEESIMNQGDDVYGDRLTASLASVGPTGQVSGTAEDQVAPVVAGDPVSGNAIVVWQDRRLNQKGNIFGSRIDSSGNVLEEDGILLLTRPNDMAEHTIAKGPGDDYVVAATEFAAQPTNPDRIYFRLVRDEEPDGMMTMTSTTVPADGQTAAALCLGPAQGASGLPLVDRTRYTLTWASTSINPGELEILPVDVDPNAPDHQLYTEDGEVCFEMTTTRRGIVDVTVASDRGNSTGTAQITFANVPPVASNSLVQGRVSMDDTPRSRDDLLLTYDYFDINDDPEVLAGPDSTVIRWRQNGAEVPMVANSTVVDSSFLDKRDTWGAIILPGDGTDLGAQLITNSVTILNSPPELRGGTPRICEVGTGACNDNAAFDPTTGDTIRAEWRVLFDDPDNDGIDEMETITRWFLDGVEQTELAGTEEVDGALVEKGQTWRFAVLPHDGEEFAEQEYFSDDVVVNNTPPEFSFPSQSIEVSERQVVELDASSASDIDPIDQGNLAFSWEQDPTDRFQVEIDDPTAPTTSFTAPSVARRTTLSFTVTVSDDIESVEATLTVQVRSLPDTDGDTIDDELELQRGTNPNATDSDQDGLRDEVEMNPQTGEFIIDPLDADADDDGVRDGNEGREEIGQAAGADPLGDPDGDGLVNALDPDSDDDGILDGTEARRTTPIAPGGAPPVEWAGTDTAAGNFVADADPTTETSPIHDDTDEDGLLDGEEDANQNGRVDPGETDPTVFNCTQDEQCGTGEVCDTEAGLCVEDDGTGNVCEVTLESQGVECCQGDVRVDPVCRRGARTESCPTGSSPFTIGTCSGGDDGGDDGGGCAAVAPGSTAPLALLWLALGGLLARRRRRG
jgi:MYXO-CTERM domain-containing protein